MKHKRKTIREQTLKLIAGGVLLGLLAGCAAAGRPDPAAGTDPHRLSASERRGWWRIRFRMDRTDDETHWERDLMIAHRIIEPILIAHGPQIHLWRFHRRSAQDSTGHQFSFLFYSSAKEAHLINRQVLAGPLLARMMADQLVRETIVDRIDDNPRPDIKDTSDSNWSPVMQVAWPHYIMGVSRMWLEMIDQISANIGTADPPELDQLIAHYKAVDAEVTTIWQQEAYHALFHHLNAIYGYRPMIYWEKRLKTF